MMSEYHSKDTPEQARLRKAVADMRATMPDPYNLELVNLIVSAEAMLPKREAWGDFGRCDVFHSASVTALQVNSITWLSLAGWDYNPEQRIRAACLIKHSKRLMDAIATERDYEPVISIFHDINDEADRLIGEATHG